MFQTLIVQPIFNLLVLILALVPGHNFGLAIIIFTIIIRLLLWPLVKKQLHQAKLMRKIQPELKQISKEAKGDRQKQALLQMELYKERGISPFQSIGVVLLQLPILIGLYIGLQKVTKDPHELVNFAYGPLRDLPWIQQLSDNIRMFDSTLFGLVDLHRAAIGNGKLYIPALIIVVLSAIVQYYQAKQLAPHDPEARSLRAILKDAGNGKQADQSEVNSAVSRFTLILLPAMVFLFTIGIASALSLYILVGSLVAFIQQSFVLREDAEEMRELSKPSAKDTAAIPEAEVVATPEQSAKKKPSRSKKRRRK
ncbi:MAG TPA: membrane protein insertase YidC [Candidatus Limnocylindrales bacterium]|nr:membrane protein insertase YidC [Candidatus Limnocylindrales bacterium]